MSDSDDEEPAFYAHAIDDGLLGSAADKQRKALNHFNYFLKGYCKQIGIDPVEAKNIPYLGIPLRASKKDAFGFWDDMISRFVTYLGRHAMQACNPKRDRLAKNTADGFFSSVKVFFTNKFRNEDPIPVFQKTPHEKLRAKLIGLYRESDRAKGNPKTQEVSSTRQDREAMATACIWSGSRELAQFWHLQNTSYHCTGRGSEVSLIKSKGVTAIEMNELVYKYHVLAVELQRQKNGPFQTLPIYPHRDGILEDFYFSLIHLIVVNGCSDEYVLQLFSNAALRTKKSGESDSGVSKAAVDKVFKSIRNTFEGLADEINEELGSHSNRRGSNQAMVESPSLGGYAPIFRSGLKSKSIHTIFDYIFGSAELLRQGGKALSRWVTKIGETTVGGQPPTFDDIDTDPDALRRLTDVIFEDDADGRWHPKVRELLVMTLLLRCDQFVDILQSHPFSKLVEGLSTDGIPEDYSCSSVRDNLFLSRVNQALEKAVGNDRDLIFSNWVGEARRAFLSRNAPGLPIGTFPLYGGDPGGRGILMDTRCFTDHFNALASIAQANHMRLQSLEHKVNDIRSAFNVESKITSSFIVDRLFNIQKSVRRLEENLIGAQTPAPAPTLPKALLRFSRSGPSEGAPVSLTEATIGFFYDNYPAGYELDKRSPSWEEFDSNKKKALGSKLNTIRNAVRVVLLHADSCPLKQNSSEYWNKADIRGIAREAEKRVCEALETLRLNASVQDCKTITISNLERAMKDPKWKEYEKSLVLPANTPDDIRKVLKKNRS